ncbi:hypothetical protein IJT10_00030, partial [bacterium]|nr:hypothetical protein [bacterium]
MFKSLEYTEIAEKRLERYEDGKCGERGTKNNLQHIFSLYEKKILNLDQLLWLQAYEGFSFLSETTFGRAKELCRLVFRDVLHGEETKDGLTYDGKIYSSLTDDDLIKKMVEKLRSCYKKSGMHDVYPGDGKLIKYLLGGSKFERETLVKLLIASGIGYDRIQDFLGRLAFMKKLSVAVPNELVWIYCLKKGLKWEKATELSEIAEELYNEAIQERAEVEADDRIPYTDENIGGLLDGVPEERFIEEFLVICCKRAAKKSREIKNNEKQYSQTAWIIVKELSVFDVQHYGAELQNEIEKLQNKDLKRDFQRKFKELKEKIQKELEKELSEDSRENFRRKFEKLEEKIQEKLEEELQQGIGTLQRYSERCQKRLKEELPEDSKERVQKELGECQKILEELEEKKIREKLKRKLQKKLSPYSDPKCYSSKKRYLFRSDMLRCYKKC